MSFSEEFWTLDPSTGGKLASYLLMEPQTCLRYARDSSDAFSSWKDVSFEDRAGLLGSLAGSLRREREKLARMITHEMGKPIKQSQAEVEKCAWAAEVVAREGGRWLEAEAVETDARRSKVSFEPLGVILGVEPWNFPSWQALRFAIPTVMAGNTVLLRHSNIVPGSALLLEEVFKEAGFPDGVFKVILTGHKVIQDVIASPLIKGVSFTGSNVAGSAIGALAGKFTKKSVLELGGSDAFIVLEDANLKAAAQAGAESRLINSGQSCINAKRFIIMDSVYEEFRELFVREVSSYIVGDPLDPMTDVGPLVREAQLRVVESQVRDAVRKGAKITYGGKRMAGSGYFYQPTVLENFSVKMKVLYEEVFGPVAPLVRVKDDSEAAEWANSTVYGLGAAVWTKDAGRASRMADKLDAGVIFVNGMVKSDPRMPFGGVKESGYGREVSKYGIREFTNIKGVNFFDSTA